MKGAVKAPELNSMVAVEERMQIQKMVATIVVMGISIAMISFVPDILDAFESSRLFGVHAGDKLLVHVLAVSCSLLFNPKCFVEEVVSCVDDVYKISN